jgi:hypothetical protein
VRQAAAVLQSLPNPLFGMACPDVYSPGRLLLRPGGVAERLCRLLQRACNAIFLGL